MSGYEIIRWVTTPFALAALFGLLIAKHKGKPSVQFLSAFIILAAIGVGSYLSEAYWKHTEVVQRTTQQDELRFGGTVSEEGGGPLLNGVRISIAGVEHAETDAAGDFALTIPSPRASETYKVLFTRDGYETLERMIQGPKPEAVLIKLRKKISKACADWNAAMDLREAQIVKQWNEIEESWRKGAPIHIKNPKDGRTLLDIPSKAIATGEARTYSKFVGADAFSDSQIQEATVRPGFQIRGLLVRGVFNWDNHDYWMTGLGVTGNPGMQGDWSRYGNENGDPGSPGVGQAGDRADRMIDAFTLAEGEMVTELEVFSGRFVDRIIVYTTKRSKPPIDQQKYLDLRRDNFPKDRNPYPTHAQMGLQDDQAFQLRINWHDTPGGAKQTIDVPTRYRCIGIASRGSGIIRNVALVLEEIKEPDWTLVRQKIEEADPPPERPTGCERKPHGT